MNGRDRIARAAGTMSIATLLSRILGYLKDMILARYFGATGLSDTFFVAFRIPNLLRELFAEGSMSSAFIPVLTEYNTKEGFSEAKRLTRIAFTFLFVIVGLICILGIILTPQIVAIIAPGFLKDPSKFDQTVLLTRIMFPFLLFISLASITMGALNTKKVFFIPALAPAMLNITIIAVILLFAYRVKEPIVVVAAGVTLGGLVQFLFQLPAFFSSGYDLRPDFSFRHSGLRRIALLVTPATMGMAVAQINIFVSTILASYLPQGSITYLYYSMRLVQFPVGIFGVAMGMAVLPMLSEHAARGDRERMRDDISFSLRLLFFITVPAMAGLIGLREQIVNILFQRGVFDYNATMGTSEALLFYSIGIWAIVGVRVMTASFYSLHDTKTPVKVAIIAMSTNIIFSILLMRFMKHSGLAFANSIASILNLTVLFYLLRKRLGRIDGRRIISSLIKTSIASILMALSGWFVINLWSLKGGGDLWKTSGMGAIKSVYLGGTMLLCLAIYLLISALLKSEEFSYLYGTMVKRLTNR